MSCWFLLFFSCSDVGIISITHRARFLWMIYEKNSSWQIRHSSIYSGVISRNAGIDHMTINKVISGFDLISHNLFFCFFLYFIGYFYLRSFWYHKCDLCYRFVIITHDDIYDRFLCIFHNCALYAVAIIFSVTTRNGVFHTCIFLYCIYTYF